MACGVTVLRVTTLDETSVEISGIIEQPQTCPTMSVEATFPSGVDTAPAEIVGGAWRATFRNIDSAHLKTWCESANPADPVRVKVKATCSENGVELCSHTETKTLLCCPLLTVLAPEIGRCEATNDGSFREYRWPVQIDRPPGYVENVRLELRVWQVGETPNGWSAVHETFPETDGSVSLSLRADRDYIGRLSIVFPNSCSDRAKSIAQFHVPACPCDTVPLPEDFFVLTDPQGTVVTNTDDTACVNGDTVTATAASPPAAWRVTAGTREIAFERIDDLSIRVPLPADGSRVIITATLTDGDCSAPVPISVSRCAPCVAVPDDYALIVVDADGNAVADGECVPGTVADITAPDHQGPVGWTVDNSPRTSDTGTERRLLVTLDDDNEHTVSATVGLGGCATVVTRKIKRCPQRFPKLPWCMLLLFIAMCCFFVGHIVFTIGSAFLLAWPCFLWVATFGTYGVVAAGVAYAIVAVLTFIGAALSVIGTVLIFVWLFVCRGCSGGLKSPYSFCQMLQLCAFVLGFGSLIAFGIDLFIYLGSGIGGAFCGVKLAGPAGVFVMGLQAAAVFLDLFGLVVPILIVHYIGNAIGCFNTWPIRFIPIIRINLPAFLSVRCPDEFTPEGD